MAQVTWRASDELIDRVRAVAGSSGYSMNEFVTRVLDAATDPDLAGGEAARIRERLERAGLLAESSAGASAPRPRVEVPSAIWRKQRMGELSAEDAAILVAAFEADYHGAGEGSPGFAPVAVRPVILERTARLLAVHALQAYAAIQLASALTVTEVVPECSGFAVLDRRLRAAAALEGLALLPPG
ncbi:MAG TPA: type II toxin-antitoxin system VapC family toxin [Pseudonocardia sp.]|jgi:hypothetical protein|nr:type II toxin-antitoxin system VapC family toxin [Pseudonocardia sp.]